MGINSLIPGAGRGHSPRDHRGVWGSNEHILKRVGVVMVATPILQMRTPRLEEAETAWSARSYTAEAEHAALGPGLPLSPPEALFIEHVLCAGSPNSPTWEKLSPGESK